MQTKGEILYHMHNGRVHRTRFHCTGVYRDADILDNLMEFARSTDDHIDKLSVRYTINFTDE